MKHRTTRTLIELSVFLATMLISVCLFQIDNRSNAPVHVETARPVAQVPVQTVSQPEEPEQVDYSDEEKLFHQGYEISRVDDTISYKEIFEHTKPGSDALEISYVVVKRHGKTVAKFDGVYHPWGNSADFGLFDLLGDKSQQLIVSLTRSRGGRHWVASVRPMFRILFDSADYDVGREEFYVIDVDKDGVHEICLPKVSFYGMDGLRSVSETPLPEIIFKYDARQMKYLPANHLFVDYALRNLGRKPEEEIYQHRRFDILLQYVYAGKEKEGWASFNKHYPSPDKEKMKARIKARLNDDPVYKIIYQQRKN